MPADASTPGENTPAPRARAADPPHHPQPAPQSPHPPPPFAHPAEAEFARLLDFYRVAWRYEPTSFPVAWHGGRVTERFTPDFYLPEQDLYVELTTMRQELLAKKHRKIRKLRAARPDVNVLLVSRRDWAELLGRFGYGAVELT